MTHRAVHGSGDHPGQDGQRVSDEQLLRAVREGDSHAFATLYERHRGAALAVARMHSRNEPEAEDLVSEAFTRVFALLKEGKGPREFLRAYLVTAVSRLAADRANELSRTRPEDPQPDGPLDRVQLFDDTVVRQVDSVVVARAFASLPERWQEVLWYLEIEGRRPRQVASAVGIQPNAVSALGKRAREGLRTAYMQEHVSARALEDCGEYSRQLGAFARGSLTPSRTKVVQEHLDSCPRCTAEYLQLQDLGVGMRGWLLPVLAGLPLWGGAGDRLVEALVGTSLAGSGGAASQVPGAAGIPVTDGAANPVADGAATSAVEGAAGGAPVASKVSGAGAADGSGGGAGTAGAASGAAITAQSSGIAAFASSGTGLAVAAVGVLVAAAAAVGIVAVSNSSDDPSGGAPAVSASPEADTSHGDAAASGSRGSSARSSAGRDGGASGGGASGGRGSAAGADGTREGSGGSADEGSVARGDSDASRPDQARENAPQGRGPDGQVGRDQGDSQGVGPGGVPLPGLPGAPGNGGGGATSSTDPDSGTDPDVPPTASPSPFPGDANSGGNPADPGEGTSPAPSDVTQSPVPSPSTGVTSPPPTTTDPDCEVSLGLGGREIICLDGLPPVPTLPPLPAPPLPSTPLLPSASVPSVSLNIVMPR